jgi:dUTP pyrophosphatase
MTEKIELKVKRISEEFADIPLPSYATRGSAGMDVRAAVDVDFILPAGQVRMVPTNISTEIPEGYELQARPRSGLAAKNSVGLLNSPGTIDCDFRGEIKIIMFNFGNEDFVIKRGDRIAQLVLAKYYTAKITEVDALADTQRGEGGFGHSGVN